MMRIIIYIGLAIVLVVAVYIAFLYVTYINRTVTEGSAYGFSIGMTKHQAHESLMENYTGGNVYIMLSEPGRADGFGPRVLLKRNSPKFDEIKYMDRWNIFFRESFHNSIKLSFEQDMLVSIHRHRKFFEVP